MCEECKVSRVYKALSDLKPEISAGSVVCAYPDKDETYLVFKRGEMYINVHETRSDLHQTVEDTSFDGLLYTMYMMQECDCERDAIWFIVDTSRHEPCKGCKTFTACVLEEGLCLWCRGRKNREAFNTLLGDISIDL